MGRTQAGHRDPAPTTVVVCGDAAQAASIRRPPGVPLTWIVDATTLERIEERDAGLRCRPWTATDAVALVIEPRWLASRHAAREAVAAARAVHADLGAGVLRDAEFDDPGLAVSAGLRTVLVRSFTAMRAARRPAPAGWACRNPVWGLWEVRASEAPPRRSIWGRLLGRGRSPAAGPGGLVVLDASRSSAQVLQRWLDWAARGVAAGTAAAVTLPDVADLLDAAPVAMTPETPAADRADRRSVLRAA